MTTISVVTVVRNNLIGLQETCHTVWPQLSSHLRHIVIDGASSDGTAAWLSRNKREHLKWISAPDDGIYEAMNVGLGLVEGDDGLVIFLNGGDKLAGHHVVDELRASYERDGWPWAHGWSRMIDAGGRPRVHRNHFLSRLRFKTGLKSIPHQSAVFSVAAVRRLGGYDPTYGIAADQELMYRMFEVGRPRKLELCVAECDAYGLSSQQKPGAFVHQMYEIRERNHRLLLGSRRTDHSFTRVAAAFRVMRAWTGKQR